MAVYIQSAAQITIQSPLCDDWFTSPIRREGRYFRSVEPDFKAFIDPMASRRMGRLLKRAIASAMTALDGYEAPLDAIVTGTGLGCIETTEKFLNAMLRDGEQALPPSFFMQSTHNTIGSVIAQRLKCHGYNNTFTHRGTSFDCALQDALAQFELGDISSALVCANDEMTEAYFQLFDQIGYWKREDVTEDMFRHPTTTGSFAGEVSAAFLSGGEPTERTLCRLEGMELLYEPTDERFRQAVEALLGKAGITREEVDAVVCGYNADRTNDEVYTRRLMPLFPQTTQIYYKHLFGEGFSASAMGYYVAATCLKRGEIPAHIRYKEGKATRPKHILVYNHFQDKDHSIALLSC